MGRAQATIRLPYLPFYGYDWLGSPRVQAMPYATRGMYLTLLIEQWHAPQGSLADNLDDISARLGLTSAELVPHWVHLAPCFPRNRAGRRANPKLASLRKHIRSGIAARRSGGERKQKAQAPNGSGTGYTSIGNLLTGQQLRSPKQISDQKKYTRVRACLLTDYLATCPHDPRCTKAHLCGRRREIDAALADGRITAAAAARLRRPLTSEGD